MRIGMLAVCSLAVLVLPRILSAATQGESMTVKTAQGKVHGKTINEGKVRAFLGLPYAAAPVGDLRWRAPQPAAMWKGVRDATKFGAHCAQNHVFDDLIFQDDASSEDCLFLNVYTPADATDKSKLPVMFWIHGGAYAVGASSEPRHNGDFLPTKGVVLVTINYRLGVFGFLATSMLAKEANGAAGNYGLMDMVAALDWVKANIASFGGDAGNVTVFGESAGSVAVSTLMAAPAARGLFHKAIGESGSALGEGELVTKALSIHEKSDDLWVAALGVNSLAELRALPTDKLLEAAQKKGVLGFMPDIDGQLLTESVSDAFAAGRQAQVPLLAGWNRDEGSFFANRMTIGKWKDFAAKNFHERAAEFLHLYPGETDAQAADSARDYDGDAFIAFGTWQWLEAHRKTGAPGDRFSSPGWKTGKSPVYRYRFELRALPSKYHPGAFAFHSDEIEYVFGTLDTRPGAVWRPEDRKLSDEVMSYWTNFARTGDPNGARLPVWPKYDKNDELIHLDSTITSGPDTMRPRYEFLLKGIPAFQF
jgi:para-nitrobenzyl esterase